MSIRDRVHVRYSEAFKMQVIKELESGKFANQEQARRRYGIKGSVTIRGWLKKYGRTDLMVKAIRVEKPNEQDQLRSLQAKIGQLEKALANTQIESLLNKSVFEVLCDQVGVEPEAFKKKVNMQQSTKPKSHRLRRKK